MDESTPEMIAAGVEELIKHPVFMEPDVKAMAFAVERVYRVMEMVRVRKKWPKTETD